MKTDFIALKILIVTNMYPHDANPGWGTFVMSQVESLRRLGLIVDVIHFRGDESKLNYIHAMLKVLKASRKNAYHLVHAHYGLSGVPALCRFRIPLVVTLHGSDILVGKVQPFISRLVCRMADGVIVVSKEMLSIIKGRGNLIPCGVDTKRFRPINQSDARKKLGLPEKRKIVLFPFDPKRKVKRYDLAKSAIDRLRSLGYHVDLLCVCGVSNEQMPWYYNASDVMVLCSYSEGSPTSVKEALACGLPVVSCDVGDVREIMEGIPGNIICDGDPDAIANAIGKIISSWARDHIINCDFIKRYDQEIVAKQIVKVYERVLRQPRFSRVYK